MKECSCQSPPFHYSDFNTLKTMQDSNFCTITVEQCTKCHALWLKYMIEEEFHSATGCWWRVGLDNIEIDAESARAYIENCDSGFVGGSYYNSAGSAYSGKVKLR